MPKLAPDINGIAAVASSAARDALYPSPELNRRVYRTDTLVQERWNGAAWIVDPIDYANIANAPGVDASFANNTITTTGLTYGYNAGTAVAAGGVITRIVTGTIALSNNATNYVERTYAGVVSKNTIGFTPANIPMALVTTAAGAITAIIDYRTAASSVIPYPPVTGEVSVVDVRYPLGHARRYGAVGDGVATGDMTAIQAAVTSRSATGGGDVFVPAGTYLGTSAQLQGSHKVFIYPRSNVRIAGERGLTGFKAANGLNTAVADLGFNFIRHIVADESLARIDNFSVSDIIFDHNGLNNLIPNGFTGKDNVAVGVQAGSNLRVERCWFKTNAGRQTLVFGNNVTPQSCSSVFIVDNLFTDMGGSVTGNTFSADHSSIYIQTIGGVVRGNVLANSNPLFRNTAIDTSCTDVNFGDNTIINFQDAVNIGAQIADMKRCTFHHNVGTGIGVAFNCYQTGAFRIDEVTLDSNVFEQAANYITPGFLDLDSNIPTTMTSLKVINNTFRCLTAAGSTGIDSHGMQIGRIKSLEVRGNTWKGFSGRAIELGTIDATMHLLIDDEHIVDCGTTTNAALQHGIALNSATAIEFLAVRRCTVENVAATYMLVGITGNAPLTKGELSDNTCNGFPSGSEIAWNNAASPYIRHAGLGRPDGFALQAKPGSMWSRKDPAANALFFMKGGTLGDATGWVAAIFVGDAPVFLQPAIDTVGAVSMLPSGSDMRVEFTTDDTGHNFVFGKRVATVFTALLTLFDNSLSSLTRFAAGLQLNGSAGPQIRGGAGNPNTAIVGSPGDIWMNTTGGANVSIYIKESGVATNTGWVAK